MSERKNPREDTNYDDAPQHVVEALKPARRRIEDTLPALEELVRKKQSVTIPLEADVVERFKEQGGHYQMLINEVSRRYKDHFSGRRAS
jgi:uncharacterized protein (DUF4415 family)